MRLVMLILLSLFLALQYRLWLGKNSVPDYWRLQQEVTRQQETNERLRQRNQLLAADIADLRDGEEALEERARNELGLIKQRETFFRIVPVKN
ncbi:cell division protein FtsB [Pseudidiomarina planktonica]|uniref:Cell division protein FtsB n=1 Tax=Pseudidiomarina planktonica TaxID=1323738 RepID=A0A1Y6EQS3_9GAMM|nr:cell division protein FtsB [Pseudidiomarina planktonica]RUO65511.1 cell division protein FtsB [Pseudidiomarina planktonica]SMQ64686.1 cell division protein FtsB [Pseudidiomarina planktonica]